jgi:hypothetical protein
MWQLCFVVFVIPTTIFAALGLVELSSTEESDDAGG